ncbi:MAG TPA: DUF3644 domain-containing protein [Bacteroidales bacterium]|nr:DUF3644 domain-containing protein [Bacteroidales bacterium]
MKGEARIVKQLLQKAKDSALLAIEFYNKPAVNFKSEGFITMMCIAWTSLFHAYFFKNKIKPFYKEKENGRRSRYKKIPIKLPDGKILKENKWWELSECLNNFYKSDSNHPVRKNLEFFTSIRNMIVHRNIPELDSNLYAECQANILNFNDFLKEHFGDKHSIDYLLSFTIQMFKSNRNLFEATKSELKKKNALEIVEFIKSFRSSLSSDVFESPEYAYKAILIQVKNHESKDALPLKFINVKDLTDEQQEQLRNMMGIVLIKEKTVNKDIVPLNFSLTYKQLQKKVKEKIPHIQHFYFEKIKQYLRIKYDNQLAYKRIHNPKSLKSQCTYYYDEKIIDEFIKICPPITTFNQPIISQFELLVDKILAAKKGNPQADTSTWEREIDRLVYKIYDLTEEEIRIIENKN